MHKTKKLISGIATQKGKVYFTATLSLSLSQWLTHSDAHIYPF